MNQLGVLLQQSSLRVRSDATPSVAALLGSPRANGADHGGRRRRSLKERLGFTGMGCCGPAWMFGQQSPAVRGESEDEDGNEGEDVSWDEVCASPIASGARVNLGAAMAEEEGESMAAVTTPARVSLMRLLEETEKGGWWASSKEREREGEGEGRVRPGTDAACCVCMVREKGAAFIPCGHTYCRVCSIEVWLSRGSCPLCNCLIVDVLDIY